MATHMMTLAEVAEQHPGILIAIEGLRGTMRDLLAGGVDPDDLIPGLLTGIVMAITAAGDAPGRRESRDTHAELFEEWAEFLRSEREIVFPVAGTG